MQDNLIQTWFYDWIFDDSDQQFDDRFLDDWYYSTTVFSTTNTIRRPAFWPTFFGRPLLFDKKNFDDWPDWPKKFWPTSSLDDKANLNRLLRRKRRFGQFNDKPVYILFLAKTAAIYFWFGLVLSNQKSRDRSWIGLTSRRRTGSYAANNGQMRSSTTSSIVAGFLWWTWCG